MLPKNKDYDKRIFRLMSILNNLDSGEKVSSRQLSKDFNVSIRSIQRDIDLLNQTGFLLASTEKGTYSFEEGFSLKKLRLTNEEASLMSFLYEMAKPLGKKFEDSFRNILKKVIQEEYDTPFYAKMPEGMKLKKDYPFLETFEEAIDENRKIKISYDSADGRKNYKLCPLKIIFYDGFWYLLSQADGREGVLKFRIDKIKEVAPISEYFLPPENLKTMLEESVNIWFSQKRNKKVFLKVDKDVAPYFRQRVYFPLQRVKEERKDGSIVIETKISQYEEIVHVIMHWIPHITVLAPQDLKKQVKKRVSDYLSICK